jgi:hypothetical protein
LWLGDSLMKEAKKLRSNNAVSNPPMQPPPRVGRVRLSP